MSAAVLLLQLVFLSLCVLLAWRIASLHARSDLAAPYSATKGMETALGQAGKAAPAPMPSRPARRDKQPPATARFSKADRVAKAQIFAGIQMLDAKMQGVNFRHGALGGACEKLAAAYLTGAARAITFKMDGGEEEALDVTAFLLTHNLSFKTQAALQALNELTRDENTLASFRAGLEAAESWMSQKFVPEKFSLYRAIADNAFI